MTDKKVLWVYHGWFLDVLTGKVYVTAQTELEADIYNFDRFKRWYTDPGDLDKIETDYQLDLTNWQWVDMDSNEFARYPSVLISPKYRKKVYINYMLNQL